MRNDVTQRREIVSGRVQDIQLRQEIDQPMAEYMIAGTDQQYPD